MQLNTSLLTQLRAFAAVARHKSFKRAAEEMHVTQSALSHHVRHLEQELGVSLLKRLHRRIELTSDGQKLYDGCRLPFEALAAAVHEVRHRAEADSLTVSVAPYFSARWLTPRLGRLWNRHPALDLQLRHAYLPADFLQSNVDAGISWGHGRWSNVESVLLVPGTLSAVCSPALRAKLPARLKAQHLLKHRLFYEFNPEHWKAWFQASGVVDEHSAIQIDDSHSLRGAVVEGQGIGLFFKGLMQEDLSTGQLVQLLDVEVDSGCGYYLVRPKDRPIGQKLEAFIRWILDEARLRPYA
jgi:DNA-binding transcriptional LysR family regulator